LYKQFAEVDNDQALRNNNPAGYEVFLKIAIDGLLMIDVWKNNIVEANRRNFGEYV